MRWMRLTIETTPIGVEVLCGVLDGIGVTQLEILDDSETVEEFLNQTAQFWDYIDESVAESLGDASGVRLLLADNDAGWAQKRELLETLGGLAEATGLELGTLAVREEIVDDEDWADSWKQHYKPLEIGARLLIQPQWEQAEAAGRVTVTLDPGMVFGTGQHESTALCLETLEDKVRPGARVLDIGCGSGILGIAALRLGAGALVGVDVDANAPDIALRNAGYNGLGEAQCRFIAADILEDGAARAALGGGYDLVLANIVAGVLLPLTPLVPPLLKADGWYLLSGIIAHREEEVRAALAAAGFGVVERRQQNDWVALAARREGARASVSR